MKDKRRVNRRAFLAFAGASLLPGCVISVRIPASRGTDYPPLVLEPYDPSPYQEFEPLYQEPDPVIEQPLERQPQQFDRQGPTPTSRYVSYNGTATVGSVIINRATRKVYFVDSYGSAIEYNIAVGAEGTGVLDSRYTIQSKRVNPKWTPTTDMRARDPSHPCLKVWSADLRQIL